MKTSWSDKIKSIQKTRFRDTDFYVLRDDLIGGEFNGNKARKLEYFLRADLGGIKRVVSYGSSQSNAMYSLSVFAKIKGLEFHYVVSNLNSNLSAKPVGNLKFALENGMKIYVDKDRRARARALAYELAGLGGESNLADEPCESWVNLRGAGETNEAREQKNDTHYVSVTENLAKDESKSYERNFGEQTEILNAANKPNSGSLTRKTKANRSNLKTEFAPNLQSVSEENLPKFNESPSLASSNLPADYIIGDSLFINEGVWQPQAEAGFISQARQIERWAETEGKVVDIFLPSGTGTSAAFLARHVKFDVYTCPCVGDADYLRREIEALTPNSKARILTPPRKYHFGDLKPELYEIWREVCAQTGIEFELIYDPVGFLTMAANLDAFKNEILYIHQGGVLGNISQKLRYERKFKEAR